MQRVLSKLSYPPQKKKYISKEVIAKYTYYSLAASTQNYVIFRNVWNFHPKKKKKKKKKPFKLKIFVKEIKEYFENYFILDPKLIN
jgi:hypothetical protein